MALWNLIPEPVYDWAGWHIIKWVFGALVLAILLFVIWKLNYDLNAERQIHDTIMTGAKKILYDTHLTNEQTIKAIDNIIRGEI